MVYLWWVGGAENECTKNDNSFGGEQRDNKTKKSKTGND